MFAEFLCISKLHEGAPVVVWSQEYEEMGEEQPYDEMYPSWSDWVLDYVIKYNA